MAFGKMLAHERHGWDLMRLGSGKRQANTGDLLAVRKRVPERKWARQIIMEGCSRELMSSICLETEAGRQAAPSLGHVPAGWMDPRDWRGEGGVAGDFRGWEEGETAETSAELGVLGVMQPGTGRPARLAGCGR